MLYQDDDDDNDDDDDAQPQEEEEEEEVDEADGLEGGGDILDDLFSLEDFHLPIHALPYRELAPDDDGRSFIPSGR